MTKEEILIKCKWDSYDMATLELEIPILKTKTKVQLIPEPKSGRKITDEMVQALNDVLKLNSSEVIEIKDFLFWFFNLCCEETSYGDLYIDFVEGETETEANKRYFGVNNRDEALSKSKLESISIEEYDGRVAILHFYAPWEEEHGCEIGIRNGEIDKFQE